MNEMISMSRQKARVTADRIPVDAYISRDYVQLERKGSGPGSGR
jgi:hypothetical protein